MTDQETEVSESEISTGSVGLIEPISAVIRPAVEVMAPIDMPEGYQFQVRTGDEGRTLQVQVPAGGVQAGQRFAAWVVMDDGVVESLQQLVGQQQQQSSNHQNNAPALRWRDGFFECFKFGACHPMCCLALWCAPCLLGQVMTRAKLTILGNPKTFSSNQQPTFWTPFKFLFALTALYIFIRGTTQTVINYKVDDDDDDGDDRNRNNSTQRSDDDDEDDSYPAWADAIIFFRFLIFVAFSLFTLVLMIKTRRHLRHKDHIPAENCGKMEDCCVSFWCPWCTVCHLARHTADYNQVEARCCTDTGLPDNEPMYV